MRFLTGSIFTECHCMHGIRCHSCHLKWRATMSSSWKVEADGAVRQNYLGDGRPAARRAP